MLSLASEEDLDMLAEMNKMLIEDEMHDNKMNAEQLKERMKGFIHSSYHAFLFKIENDVIGYALTDMSKNPLYIRHFFICRDYRKHGYGKAAFSKLLKILGTETVDIEVMYWNEVGRKFWKSIGFEERSIYMRLKNKL